MGEIKPRNCKEFGSVTSSYTHACCAKMNCPKIFVVFRLDALDNEVLNEVNLLVKSFYDKVNK